MKVNLEQKFAAFDDTWRPRIIAELNDSYVKLAKLEGEFVWHHHDEEDELFLVVRGSLRMQFRDHEEEVQAGELIVIPRGVEHRPVAGAEVWVMLVEPRATRNTGNVENERTVDAQWI